MVAVLEQPAESNFAKAEHALDRSEDMLHSCADLRLQPVRLAHPLVDLAYLCMRYHLPADELRGLGGVDAAALMLPTEAECVADYCRRRGREPIAPQDWTYYLAFCMFRLSGILQGVLARALQGNASSATALQAGRRARPLAELAWRLVQQSAEG